MVRYGLVLRCRTRAASDEPTGQWQRSDGR